VAIRVLSWILNHFLSFLPLEDGAKTNILQCISASCKRILIKRFGGVGRGVAQGGDTVHNPDP